MKNLNLYVACSLLILPLLPAKGQDVVAAHASAAGSAEAQDVVAARAYAAGSAEGQDVAGAHASAAGSANAQDVVVRVDPGRAADWTVDKRIFGRFFEHNGRDAYPGLFDQHLANGSFEPWYESSRGRRTELIFPVDAYPGVAYGWEPVRAGGVHFDVLQRRGEDDRFQRITSFGGASGGIQQKTALPDERTTAFDLSFSARGTVSAMRVRLMHPDGDVLWEQSVPVTDTFERGKLRVELPGGVGPRFRSSPFGEYVVGLMIEEDGIVDLDDVLLIGSDAVAGKFNPTTVEWLSSFNVTSMRWPGGNWASAYHWEDGVGPMLERPVRPNLAWGGLEPNYFGTNEFLEFCRLTGMEPLINAAFNFEDVPPEDAGRWVEYVNGDTTTAMGRLRAAHGYPEAWNVRLWQVGNESYGYYQIGHTDAQDYARKYIAYHDAMKAADPSIEIIVAGVDPLYYDWGGNRWNEALLDVAGERVEAIDIHRYVRGITSQTARRDWDATEYLQATVAFSTQFEDIIEVLLASAAKRERPDLGVAVGEWNAELQVSEGWPKMDYPTMAHASFVAGMFNTFIRQGRAVRYTYQRDNTLYFRPYYRDFRPVNPGAYVLKHYAEPFDRGAWHHLPVELEGAVFEMPALGARQQSTAGVPYVDGSAIRAEDGDDVIIYLTNRHLSQPSDVVLELSAGWNAETAELLLLETADPFARQDSWNGPETFSERTLALEADEDGRFHFELTATAVARASLRVVHRKNP